MMGTVSMLDFIFVSVFSVIAAAFDLATRRIPNTHVVIGLGMALALALAEHGTAGIGLALAGAAVGGGLLLPVYLASGIAGGDVKAMAVIGALAGPRVAFAVVIMTLIAGGFFALLWLLTRGASHTPSEPEAPTDSASATGTGAGGLGRTAIPFGPAMAIGALLAFYGEVHS